MVGSTMSIATPANDLVDDPVDPRQQPPGLVAARPDHDLMRSSQLQPAAAERLLVLIEAPHRLAFARLATGSGDVRATEVHLRAALADRELDRPPAEQMEGAGMVASGACMVARVDGRQALAVPVEDETRERLAVRGPRLEQHEMAGHVGGAP